MSRTTLRAALADATARLERAGVASPRHDAEALAAHLLGVGRGELAAYDDLPPAVAERFDALVARRSAREPLQHLLGSAAFRHLELQVGPGVFVPRPETESLVDWCLGVLRGHEQPLVVDLCSGSGAIALSLAHEHPGAVVHAVEREPSAFAWLERNAAPYLSVELHLADVADAPPELDGTVDLVAANPPYVPDDERVQVEPEVRDFDPPAALWAGRDGLAVVRQVERVARRLLRPGGWVAVEHSDRQGETAPQVFRAAAGWAEVADRPDLAGRPRFVTARWAP